MHVFVFLAFLYSQLSRSVTSEKIKKEKERSSSYFFQKKSPHSLSLFLSHSTCKGEVGQFQPFVLFFFGFSRKKKFVSVAHELIILNVYLLINNKFVIIAGYITYLFSSAFVSSEKQSNKDEYKSPQCSSVSFKA
ncbi:hypothetical protein WN943_021415 [Citrus x changshan-huyou]